MDKGGGEEGWERDGVKGERAWRGRREQGKGMSVPQPSFGSQIPVAFYQLNV